MVFRFRSASNIRLATGVADGSGVRAFSVAVTFVAGDLVVVVVVVIGVVTDGLGVVVNVDLAVVEEVVSNLAVDEVIAPGG